MHTHRYRRKHSQTHTIFFRLYGFCPDNLGDPAPEETFTHSHPSWSSVIPYPLAPCTTIQGILPLQFMCLTVFFHNLSPNITAPQMQTGFIICPMLYDTGQMKMMMMSVHTHVRHTHTHTHTHNHFMALLDFVRDHPGELAPER